MQCYLHYFQVSCLSLFSFYILFNYFPILLSFYEELINTTKIEAQIGHNISLFVEYLRVQNQHFLYRFEIERFLFYMIL